MWHDRAPARKSRRVGRELQYRRQHVTLPDTTTQGLAGMPDGVLRRLFPLRRRNKPRRLARQVDAQRRANTIALARYRVGYASYFNVIDADRDLFTAELSLSAARLNTLLSVVQLYRALGGGWQAERPVADAAAAP